MTTDEKRRRFLACFSGMGLGATLLPGVLWAQVQDAPAITAEMLKSALALANAEPATTVWFALKIGPSTFGIFDAFADDAGRQAHLAGQIAATLMAKAPELLAHPPTIESVEVLAAKL